MEDQYPNPVQVVIDGTLDLHHFSPRDLKYLIPDYLQECLNRDITEVRIIHGKGKGVLRRSVHAILDRLPEVHSYRLGSENQGSWGATIVLLKSVNPESEAGRV